MSTTEHTELALDDVIRLIPSGGVRDPEILRRIQERSAKIRERIGPTNIAVELIREARDEE
jgi:hypothetical protein